jgi:hypothetical protein
MTNISRIIRIVERMRRNQELYQEECRRHGFINYLGEDFVVRQIDMLGPRYEFLKRPQTSKDDGKGEG